MKEIILSELSSNLLGFELFDGAEQRSVGDLVEFKVKNILMDLSKHPSIKKYIKPRSKKSIEDLTLVDNSDLFHYIDTKSHNINSDFSMPNLTSVDRLKKLLESTHEELIYIFVSYKLSENYVNILSIEVKYVWELSFDILRIGSLGKGQLQISNMNKGLKFTNIGKKNWFFSLKNLVREYHDLRINQIEKDKLKWQ